MAQRLTCVSVYGPGPGPGQGRRVAASPRRAAVPNAVWQAANYPGHTSSAAVRGTGDGGGGGTAATCGAGGATHGAEGGTKTPPRGPQMCRPGRFASDDGPIRADWPVGNT